MRARNIKPGFFENEQLTEVDAWGRLLFVGIWMIADREGRLEDRPKRIKMQLFAMDDVDVDSYLDRLAELGFIVRYEVDNARYIQIINFAKHQRPHTNEAQSVIPPMPGLVTMDESTAHHGEPQNIPEDKALRSDSLNEDSLNEDSLNEDSLNGDGDGARAPAKFSKRREYSHDSDEYRIARLLAAKVRENLPSAKAPTEAILQRWSDTARKMHEIDERPFDEMRSLLLWSQQETFWQSVILSMDKFREKYDQITAKRRRMEREAEEAQRNGKSERPLPEYVTNEWTPERRGA